MATETQLRNGLYGFEIKEDDRRRALPGERKTYEVKQLWQLHHEILNLKARGFKSVEIAKILNVSEQTVSNTLNCELGEEKLSELREIRDGETKVRLEQIRILTDKAIGVYNEVFDNEAGNATMKERLETADKVLLELSGLRVPTKIMSQSNVTILNATEIDEFKKRGIEAMRSAGLIASDPDEKLIEGEVNVSGIESEATGSEG